MRTSIMALLAASLLITSDKAPTGGKPKPATQLWAGVGVEHLVYRPGTQPARLMMNFALVNDGDKAINPDVESSQLLVNGKVLEDWSLTIRNGPRDDRWESLPPGDYILFAVEVSRHFKTPGLYKIVWKAKQFQAREVEFRVLPKVKN
jgi:hypothetical protein